MRGADPAPPVTDLPGVSRLPGVPADNPDRKPPEVSPSPPAVAKRKLEHKPRPVAMNMDEKLEFLNSFRLIRRHPPRVKNPKYQDLIQKLYFDWIDEQMLQVLSPGAQLTASLSPEEIGALKILAQTILQRQQGSARPDAPQAPAPMVPRTGAAPQPLKPVIDVDRLKQAQWSFLQELSQMEGFQTMEERERTRR